MYRRMKKRESRSPLLVKEIILPRTPSVEDNNSGFWPNSGKVKVEGSEENAESSYMRVGQQDVEGVLGLTVLQDSPLENYFEGTRKGNKSRKRKMKHHRVVIPPNELFSDGAQTLSKEERKQQTEKAPTEEEKTEIHLLDMRIYEYEKMREQELRENCVRQRMAEKVYMFQLDDLASIYFEVKKRRHRTKNVDGPRNDVVFPKSFSEETPHKRNMNRTSVTARESSKANPDTGSSPGKLEKVVEEMCPAQPSDGALEYDFCKKLVFADEETDEFY